MTTKLEKLLRAVSKKEFDRIAAVTDLLKAGDVSGLTIKQLSHNAFRVRVGNFRIFFHYDTSGRPSVDDVRRRNEKTYK